MSTTLVSLKQTTLPFAGVNPATNVQAQSVDNEVCS